MADGRRRDEWDRTATLMALTANIHRDPKVRPSPFQPDDFHPYRQKRRPNVVDRLEGKDEFRLLKRVFVDRKTE